MVGTVWCLYCQSHPPSLAGKWSEWRCTCGRAFIKRGAPPEDTDFVSRKELCDAIEAVIHTYEPDQDAASILSSIAARLRIR